MDKENLTENEKIMSNVEKMLEKSDFIPGVKAINMANKGIHFFKDQQERKKLEIEENIKKIESLEIEINKLGDDQKKEKINLMGKLINAYKKQEKYEEEPKRKYFYRHERIEKLKDLKELTKKYKTSNKKLKITEKVALNIKEIATSIKIFTTQKDVLTKVKNIFKETLFGSGSSFALIGSIGIAAQILFGIPFSLASISSALPVVAYIGLSSLIRNLGTKTAFEKYEYYQSEEYKAYLMKFKDDNKEILEELDKLLKEKATMVGFDDKFQMNEALIKKIDEVCSLIKDEGLRNAYELQALGFCRENKDLCQKVIDDYLDEKNDDVSKYTAYHKKLAKINFQIFKRSNSIKEAFVHAGKGVVANTAVMVLAKSIFTVVAPHSGYAIKGLQSFAIPIAFALVNGLIDIPTYAGKLKYKETSGNVKIDPEESDLFNRLFGRKKLQMA